MKTIVLFLIHVYRAFFSPIKNAVLPYSSSCRYVPTCSEYTIEAVSKYGVIKGLFLGTKRILSCSPFGGHGYKPLT